MVKKKKKSCQSVNIQENEILYPYACNTHDQEPDFVVNSSSFLYRFLFSKFEISELCHIVQLTKKSLLVS